uniref:Uncharacterized protein n=1 Tax=Nymphaea colorata TaxID=210225 RepID=A0A5K1HCW5_9MAGN|nr:unnamed protein product [Nymphaea colorata]
MNVNFVPRYLWIGLKTSGQDPVYNRILEFECILTDGRLYEQQEGPHLILNCDEEHLKTM